MRAGVLAEGDFPAAVAERFGPPGGAWIGEMIDAVIDESLASGEVRMDRRHARVMNELRDFMFERVYLSPTQRTPQPRWPSTFRRLVDYHLDHPEELPDTYRDRPPTWLPRSSTTSPA